MIYDLLCRPSAQAVWASLPEDVAAALALAIEEVCADPFGATVQWGPVEKRLLFADGVVAALTVRESRKQIYIFEVAPVA
ncbi:hypothetical protein [Kitasatospora sp. NPDC056731]|uniref:hypothetical protein n=1 Tax=Kitasatospora sp. NPDC056731 TaxID=3155422 RepID=UPI00343ED187